MSMDEGESISLKAREAILGAFREVHEARITYRDGGMKESFLGYIENSGTDLSEEQREAIGNVFQEFVEGHIHEIAEAFDYM